MRKASLPAQPRRHAAAMTLCALLAVAGPRAMAGQGSVPASQDPWPAGAPAACDAWFRAEGSRIVFRAGTADPADPDRAALVLARLADSLLHDGGVVTVEILPDGAAVPAAVAAHLPAQREGVIRSGLAALGVRETDIWVRSAGPVSAIPPATPGAAEGGRAILRNPVAGTRCRAERRQERLAWFQRNCWPRPPSGEAARAACTRALSIIRRGDADGL